MLREFAGRYRLQRKLGAGAWATVYEALDNGASDRRVAVKVFRLAPPGGGSSAAEEHARFRRGAAAANGLSHPHVVSVFDYGEDGEIAWIVMEVVEGGTLKAMLGRGERPPAPVVVRLVGQILDALAHAHSRGVVHRDLKPANILLTRDRVVKVADFGVARIESPATTHVGTVLGSPAYMAPEQFRGDATDHRADIWAVGVILYQMLTGERPFEGGATSIMQKVLHAEPVPPSLTRAAAPARFDAVVAKALAKRPEDRFSSAEDFAEAIRDAAAAAAPAIHGHRPAPPRPPPVARRPPARDRRGDARPPAKRARSRRPWGALAGGIGVAALGALAAGAAGFLLFDPPPAAPVARPGAADAASGAEAALLAALPAEAPPPATAGAPAPPAPVTEASPPSGAPARDTPATAAASRPPPLPAVLPTPDAPPARSTSPSDPPAAAPPAADLLALGAAPRQPAPRQPAPRRRDIDAAAVAAAASAINCGVVSTVAGASGVSLAGVARRGEAEASEAALAALGLPASAARIRIEPFDGPYCDVLARVRGVASAAGAPAVALDSPNPLPGGEVLRFRVRTPDWPAHIHVAYLMTTGKVGNLFSTTARRPPRSSMTLTDPKWEAADPFGTDLLLVIASERPLFKQKRRIVEGLDRFAADLGPALGAAREKGGRVAAQVVAVRTVLPRRGAP